MFSICSLLPAFKIDFPIIVIANYTSNTKNKSADLFYLRKKYIRHKNILPVKKAFWTKISKFWR